MTLHLLLGLLPLLSLSAVWMAVTRQLRDWWAGLLISFTLTAGLTLLVTELLSTVQAIRFLPVVIYWALLGLGGVIALRLWGTPRPPGLKPLLASPIVIFLVAQFAVLLVLALASAPNNYDSMTYHMSKVAHWVDSGTMEVYPTHVTPQIYLWPLAEVGVSHLQVLTGGDRLANLVQLLAHAISVVGVSVIARNLGLSRRYQHVAALVAATTPMAVAQAATTQNDYVTTSFLVCAVAFATNRDVSLPRWSWELLVALALGLAVATKATAVLFGLPIAVWFAATRMRGSAWRIVRIGSVALGLVLLLNAGQLARNITTFDDPTGPKEPALRNAPASLQATAGNIVRNAGLNLGVPHAAVNAKVTGALRTTMDSVGIDPDDPTALFGFDRFVVDSARNEDGASSPGQWILFMAVTVSCLASSAVRRQVGGLVLALLTGYLLFSMVLKWQPYGGRLLLPLLILAAAPVAVMLSRWAMQGRWRWVVVASGLVALAASSLPWLVLSQYRPLIGSASVLHSDPEDEYFAANIPLREPYQRAATYVEELGVRRVGLRGSINDYEYPLWRLRTDGRPIRLVAVDVTNETSDGRVGRRPRVVICTSACPDLPPGGASRRFGTVTVVVGDGLGP